jgi:hypothetical protein
VSTIDAVVRDRPAPRGEWNEREFRTLRATESRWDNLPPSF